MSGDAVIMLAERVRAAAAERRRLVVRGSDSKSFLYERTDAPELDTADLTGIVDYAPAELVVTAHAGTPLAELRAALAAGILTTDKDIIWKEEETRCVGNGLLGLRLGWSLPSLSPFTSSSRVMISTR